MTEDTYNFDLTDIESMEKIIAINLKNEERELARKKIQENHSNFKAMRNISIPNHISPSLYFKPQFFKIPKDGEVRFSISDKNNMPDNMDELAFYSIIDLAHLIKNRKITVVSLTEMFLKRIATFDKHIQSFVTINPKAIEIAQNLDKMLDEDRYLGILHGIPYAAKDLLAEPTMKTTWGTPPFKDQTIDTKSTVINKLESSGAVLLGKVSLGELAWGDIWFGGQTKTPWNTEFGSSGSSAGSAASVASGFATFAIGSETHGSIVSPSTRCGVTGFRPSFGRVSRYGAMALSWSMDKLGPICHTVEDCVIVFNSIYGSDGLDPTVIDLPFKWDPESSVKDLKIGYLIEEFEKDDKHQETNTETLAKLRSTGFELIPIRLPNLPYKQILFILHCEAAAAFDELMLSRQIDNMIRQGEDTWPNVFRWARYIPAIEYIKANRIRNLLISEVNQIFDQVDILIGPSLGDNLSVTNLTGHPAISIPNGFKEDNLPTSITFMAGLYQEEALLRFAKFYQDLGDIHLRHPKFT